METQFDTEAMRAVSAHIEGATGIKIMNVDLTFMDGDQWPEVESGMVVIGELTAGEMGLFKTMVEVAEKRDRVQKRIIAILMRLADEKMENGADESETGIAGMVQMLAARPGDITDAMLAEQAKFAEAYNLMSNMLYFGLKSRFNRHGEANMGIRRGGKVVAPPKEKQS